jgi:hypothetical protein
MMTRRSSSARMAWSTAHPECRCGSRYDIFFPRRLLLPPPAPPGLLEFSPALLSCLSARKNDSRTMTGERPMRVEKQTDTARAPPWLHRVRVLLAQNTQLGLCDGIGRGTLELGPWSCSQSHVVVPFLFFIYFYLQK